MENSVLLLKLMRQIPAKAIPKPIKNRICGFSSLRRRNPRIAVKKGAIETTTPTIEARV